jgi:hypothetical protein
VLLLYLLLPPAALHSFCLCDSISTAKAHHCSRKNARVLAEGSMGHMSLQAALGKSKEACCSCVRLTWLSYSAVKLDVTSVPLRSAYQPRH